MKNVLKYAFDKHRGFAAGVALVVVGGLSGGCAEIQSIVQIMMSEGQPFTPGEKTLARQIFGEQFARQEGKKHYFQTGCKGQPEAGSLYHRLFKDIAFCFPPFHEDDYSRSKNPRNLGFFLHEEVHKWQDQTKEQFAHKECRIYRYDLTRVKSFLNYCKEQQASIVEDYARRFLHEEILPSYRYIFPDTTETDMLLQRLVENQFPGAGDARLEMEAKRRTRSGRQAVAAEQSAPVIR